MSLPAPWRVHVPLLSDWLPISSGFPTSLQLQPPGQGVMEAGIAGILPGIPIATLL